MFFLDEVKVNDLITPTARLRAHTQCPRRPRWREGGSTRYSQPSTLIEGLGSSGQTPEAGRLGWWRLPRGRRGHGRLIFLVGIWMLSGHVAVIHYLVDSVSGG